MILALETTGMTSHIYVLDTLGAIIQRKDWDSGRQLADELLGEVVQLLGAAGTNLEGLDGVIVFSGPGSFTSLRIGHTVANALASQLSIPVVGRGGENWITNGVKALPHAEPGVIAMPFYGAEANITRPKG